MAIWIPLLYDNAHFYIKGNKYSCPLQVIDAITFTKKNVLVLKTITRAIKFERVKANITDIFGNKYNTSKIMVYVTKKSVPLVLYFFACFGFFRTLKYFGVDDKITIADIKLPKGVELADKELDSEQVIASLYDPAAEAAAREAEEKAAAEAEPVEAADVPSDNGEKPTEETEEGKE